MSKSTDLLARQEAALPQGVSSKGVYVAKAMNS